MLAISNELELAFNGASPKNLVLSFDDGTVIDNEDIALESMELEQTACDESELRFGKVNSACFKVKIKCTTKSYKGLWFNASLWCEEQELPLGRFFVYTDTATSDRQYREIVAYDELFLAMNTDVSEWYKTLVFPMSLEEFRNELFDYLGIEQEDVYLPNDGIILEQTVDGNSLTGQMVIGAICEINACFGVMNNLGEFKYVRMRNTDADALYPSEELYPSEDLYPNDLYDAHITSADYRQGSLKYEEYSTKVITKVTIRENVDDYGYSIGEEGNTYVIEDNFLMYGADDETLSTVANAFLENAKFVSYTPASFKCKGKPWLEVGDLLNVYGVDRVFAMPILNRVLSGIQGLKDEFSAKGVETYGETQSVGYRAEILRLKSRTNEITRTLDETRSEITRVENTTAQSIENLQQQIDGAIETYSGSEIPTLENYPANEWLTDEVKNSHVGDLYLVSTENEEQGGFYYRFQKVNGGYEWVLLKDNEVAKALEEARIANEKADALKELLESEYSTTETTQSIISQTSNQILSSVSTTYETKAGAETTKRELQTQIVQNSDSIATKVSKGDVSSQISQEADKITISGDRFVLNATNIKIDASGNVTISGKLTTEKGSSIGGWETDGNSIFNGKWGSNGTTPPNAFMCLGSNRAYSIAGSPQISGWVFGAYPNFGVTNKGELYCSQAYFGSEGKGGSIVVYDSDNWENRFEISGYGIYGINNDNETVCIMSADSLTYSRGELDSISLNGKNGDVSCQRLWVGDNFLTESDITKLKKLIK